MTKVKGGTLAHGQLIKGIKGATKMAADNGQRNAMSRSMHRDQIGRDSSKFGKNLPDTIPTVPGQVRQTKPSHEFLHGSPLADEKQPPLKSYEKPIAIHGGMTKQQVDKFHSTAANHPTVILTDAANLGKPPSGKA